MVKNITEYCETLVEFRNNTGKEEEEDKIIDNAFMLLIGQTTTMNFLINILYYYLNISYIIEGDCRYNHCSNKL